MKKNVVVTGAGGFIGHHLVNYLVAKGYWVRGVDIKRPEYAPSQAHDFIVGDLRDYAVCEKALANTEQVYHLAADMGGIGYISGSHASIAINNTRMSINIIEAARAKGVKRIFFSSTACIYPLSLQKNPDVVSLREDMAHPAEPEEGYGWEKLYSEKLLQYVREDYGIETRVARFHNVYGPLGTYDGGREKAPAATCRKVALLKEGEQIEVWGDGEQTRSFMYIDDCVEGVYRFMQSDFPGPLNIGTEELVTINQLFEIVGEIAGKKINKKHDLSKPQGVRGRNSDNTLIRKVLNWEAKTKLKDGLAKTYHWIAKEIEKSSVSKPVDNQVIAVVGLGKLGSPMAACFADSGHSVIGIDLDQSKVDAINNGFAPLEETGLAEMISRAKMRLKATTNIIAGSKAADLIFVIVPTPSGKNAMFTNSYVVAACQEIGAAIKDHPRRPIVIITSTVMPGSMQGPIQEALEAASGKRCGEDFGLCYSPEFIALGSVIKDLLNPDFYLIGESDSKSGEILANFYATVARKKTPVMRTNFVSAELAKLSLNSFVTMKISFANTLQSYCEKIPGAHVDSVTQAIGHDARVGAKFLKGGTGFGGPCFPRDNKAMIALAQALGIPSYLAQATDRVNDDQTEHLEQLVLQHVKAGERVAILGLSYKAETSVIECSQGIELAKRLVDQGFQVSVYDPAALDNARSELGATVTYASSASACINSAKASVVMTSWTEFSALAADFNRLCAQGHILIDCWRAYEQVINKEARAGYIELGVGSDNSKQAQKQAELGARAGNYSH